MERFRLRVLDQPKRGLIWELKLFPDMPGLRFREKDGRIMGSSSVPSTVLWLRQLSDPYLKRSKDPGPIDGEAFGPASEPRWLEWEDGLRLALAFVNARYLKSQRQKRLFREGLYALPSEVVLYWFTLCFYGYRQAAGKAAFRTLLTYSDGNEKKSKSKKAGKTKVAVKPKGTVYPALSGKQSELPVHELAEYYSGAKERRS